MSNYEQQGLFDVDTSGVGEMGGGYEVYPTGQYPAYMTSIGRKSTKNGNNAYLECVYQFFDCALEGKQYISRVNRWNTNQQAVDIALKEIKALRVALDLSDTEKDELKYLNKPVVLDLVARSKRVDGKPTGEMENNLSKILPYGTPQAQAQAYAQPAPQPTPTYVPPSVPQAHVAAQARPQGGAAPKPWETKR